MKTVEVAVSRREGESGRPAQAVRPTRCGAVLSPGIRSAPGICSARLALCRELGPPIKIKKNTDCTTNTGGKLAPPMVEDQLVPAKLAPRKPAVRARGGRRSVGAHVRKPLGPPGAPGVHGVLGVLAPGPLQLLVRQGPHSVAV